MGSAVEEFPDISAEQKARMFELLATEEEADLEVFKIKNRLKEAKECAEEAHLALKQFLRELRGDQKDYPLLDRVELKAGEQTDAPTAPPPENQNRKPQEKWREVLLEELFTPTVAKKLAAGCLETVGDMADYTASGTPLSCINGIGPKIADKIEKRMVEFWAELSQDEQDH